MVDYGLLNLFGSDFAVGGRQAQNLVPGVLNCSGFVHIDVSGVGAYHALIGPQQRCYHCGVGLCSTHKKMYVGIFHANCLSNGFASQIAVGVFAVTNGLLHVGGYEALQNVGVCALVIIALKLYHSRC